MGKATLSFLCVLCGAAAARAETWPMNHRSMQIPIKIEPARRAEIRELQLFFSTDEGRNWNQGGTATPEKDAFAFTAPAEGLYWFSLIIVNRNGSKEPAAPFNLPPIMKVLVDTTKPVAQLVAGEWQGEEVVVSWQVQEAFPDWASFKLEYRTADTPPGIFTPIAARGAPTGQARFRPGQAGPVMVRLQLKDQAGNETVVQKELPAPAGSGSVAQSAAPSVPPPEPPALPTASPSSRPAFPPPSGGIGTGVAASVPPPPVVPPRESGPPVIPPREMGSPYEQGASGVRPATVRVPAPAIPERMTAPPAFPNSGAEPGGRVVAATMDSQAPALPMPGTPGGRPPAGAATGTTLSNSMQISLDYEVNKVGPSGIGSVELYLTRDQGARWDRYADDADLKPPMIVDLPGEGTYGMILIVRSKAGLGRRAPQSGDKPQMAIEVDTTAPEAQLYAPQPIKGMRDQLLVAWEARDKNLSATPITLEWSERPGGPWQPIGVDLPNTGRHTWKLPPNLPYRVFMRLLVKDAAGNASVAETAEPVLVDLSEPDAVILTVRPVGNGPR